MRLSDITALLESTSGVCIDSRRVQPGNLFIAIQGEQFDGHDFIHDAENRGAAAVVCSRPLSTIAIPQLCVNDTVRALAQIATEYRRQLSCGVIALTGSNGKTSVKEMIALILPKPSHATPGNLNNHIGAPLSVLQLQAHHRYAVFELGANHLGEIAYTVPIVQPQVTLINNIAPAHIEGFGSIDGVAQAKGEIHQGLAPEGTAVINDDDAYAHFWDHLLEGKKIIRFSATKPATIHARDITYNANGCARFCLVTPQGEAKIELHVPGHHSVSNALAAAACTYALGISLSDITTGLNQFHGVPGRMTFLPGKNKAVIIDDTYNANLRSVLTAIDVLGKRPGRRIFVFGDMGELGVWSEEHHQSVGEVARQQGIDKVLTCGTYSALTSQAFGEGGTHYPNQESLAQALLQYLDESTTVLIKGSRSSAMENIVRRVTNEESNTCFIG